MTSDRPARWVLHLDMDAFFAAVEQLTRPTLARRPVLVGGAGPRGVVAGASYQARVFGARSAMPMGQARRRCPHATVLPPRFPLYKAISDEVMGVLGEFSPVLEPVSVDEAFLEPPVLAGAPPARVEEFGTALRAAVRERTGLPASVGAGSGKQIAKIASELAKPDGLRVVAHAEQSAVLGPLPVRSLWGIGPVSGESLRKIGIETVGQLAAMDSREVAGVLGSAMGTELHRLARGIDDRPVAPRGAAKQISAETTFDTDLTAMTAVHDAVEAICVAVHRRLVADGRAARTVTVKARTGDFTTHTRSETTPFPSRELSTLTAVARRLADGAVGEGGIRLLGVSVSGFGDEPPLALFDAVPSAQGWRAAPAGAQRDGPPGGAEHEVPGGSTTVTERAAGPAPAGASAGEETSAPGAVAVVAESPAGAPAEDAPATGRPLRPDRAPDPDRPWAAGDDVRHPEHGHGWVQGAGHGRVTVRFETALTGPGRTRTLPAGDPSLVRADPVHSWRPPA
ncbi:DNA polymerase IV [Pseudonocardia sp. HH130630-07]|uniref:DNA polymerase IV n=1 Tax=Pseudonocardia sp. HH130630-07 TaxID=1690815 RepID=UPI000814F611|nr:DNA polymerase IV [Pseudonocardia sp. HH130630-07]ANY08583.1 DNA polymerase IV [Pseudonocardia sp. HH130630-07]